jgi:tRNA(fMet)-specific endonuclease VapC
MSFLIDTDICSAQLKRNSRVTARFLQYQGRVHLSVITLGELYVWALRAKAPPSRLKDLDDLLQEVEVVDATSNVARKYGEVQAVLLDKGTPAPAADLFIAATALVHGYAVVTHNKAHYAHIHGLMVEDWLVP